MVFQTLARPNVEGEARRTHARFRQETVGNTRPSFTIEPLSNLGLTGSLVLAGSSVWFGGLGLGRCSVLRTSYTLTLRFALLLRVRCAKRLRPVL